VSTTSDRDCATLLRQAISLHRAGRLPEARRCYLRILAVDPRHFEALHLLATLHSQAGRHAEALVLFEQAIRIDDTRPELFSNRGNALKELQRFDEALASYDVAIRLKPDYAEAYFNRGNVLKEVASFDAALMSYADATRLKAHYVEALKNQGVTLQKMERFEASLAIFTRAFCLKPDDAESINNMGTALQSLGRHEEAIKHYELAIAIDLNYSDAFYNRGISLHRTKRIQEALSSYQEVARLKPGDTNTHWNQSLALMLLGNLREGWRFYESRLNKDDMRAEYYEGPELAWRGQTDISGKRLFIHAEQGLGDIIQFARYLPRLDTFGAEVIFQTPPSLMSVMSTLRTQVSLISTDASLPPFDAYCPLMSLPYVFKTSLNSIPADTPYLFANDKKTAACILRLGRKRALRVGLVWSGSVRHSNDSSRSLPLKELCPILDLPIEWHSLQQEYRPSDLKTLEELSSIHRHEPHLRDFSDTAALVACMDLVISVDTSVAHLAGAMNKSVWVLLPHVPDFRWLLERHDSPWYPSARLFRQQRPGDWKSIVGELHHELISHS